MPILDRPVPPHPLEQFRVGRGEMSNSEWERRDEQFRVGRGEISDSEWGEERDEQFRVGREER